MLDIYIYIYVCFCLFVYLSRIGICWRGECKKSNAVSENPVDIDAYSEFHSCLHALHTLIVLMTVVVPHQNVCINYKTRSRSWALERIRYEIAMLMCILKWNTCEPRSSSRCLNIERQPRVMKILFKID